MIEFEEMRVISMDIDLCHPQCGTKICIERMLSDQTSVDRLRKN